MGIIVLVRDRYELNTIMTTDEYEVRFLTSYKDLHEVDL